MWRNALRMGAMLAVLAACDDARLVAPDLDGAAARLREAETVPFPCAWSVRAEGGPHRYRYGRATVAVPRAALAPDGATAEYRYVVQAPGTDPVYVARCIVPATRAAVEHLDRRFGAARTAAVTGDAVARGCVSDRLCVLEPITVQPCGEPAAGPAETTPDCGSGGGGDPGWWTGGGGPYEPPPDDGGGGGGDPGGEDPGGDDPYPPAPCDTGDPVVDSEAVQDTFDELWKASNPGGNIADRRERGGWIVSTASGYAVVPFQNLEATFCSLKGFEEFPPGGNIVGFVHTHPYRLRETIVCMNPWRIVDYQGEPSRADTKMSVALGKLLGRSDALPGYILDANGIRSFAKDAPLRSYTRCGY